MKSPVTALTLALALTAGAAVAQPAGDRFDKPASLGVARIRYMVADIPASVAFYKDKLGFKVAAQSGTFFALLTRGDVQLLLSPVKGPGGASQPMPNGERPAPGGWNRIVLYVDKLDDSIKRLEKTRAHFRNAIESGPGGRQILLDDPDGNPIELHEAPT